MRSPAAGFIMRLGVLALTSGNIVPDPLIDGKIIPFVRSGGTAIVHVRDAERCKLLRLREADVIPDDRRSKCRSLSLPSCHNRRPGQYKCDCRLFVWCLNADKVWKDDGGSSPSPSGPLAPFFKQGESLEVPVIDREFVIDSAEETFGIGDDPGVFITMSPKGGLNETTTVSTVKMDSEVVPNDHPKPNEKSKGHRIFAYDYGDEEDEAGADAVVENSLENAASVSRESIAADYVLGTPVKPEREVFGVELSLIGEEKCATSSGEDGSSIYVESYCSNGGNAKFTNAADGCKVTIVCKWKTTKKSKKARRSNRAQYGVFPSRETTNVRRIWVEYAGDKCDAPSTSCSQSLADENCGVEHGVRRRTATCRFKTICRRRRNCKCLMEIDCDPSSANQLADK